MDTEKDHYTVLGLPSGEDGSKLTDKDISKAYKSKALELHPDKRPDDPNAHDNFHALKLSYEVLKDDKKRKDFDAKLLAQLRVKRDRHLRDLHSDSKRQRMFSDLEERERAAAFEPNQATRAREKEDVIDRKNKEIYDRIARDIQNKARSYASTVPLKKQTSGASTSTGTGTGTGTESVSLDKSKMLKVSWEKGGVEYTSEKLREVFTKFGMVEEVVMKKSSKRGSALVVMASKDAAVAATGCVCGDLSNPLLVLPLQPFKPTMFQIPKKSVEPDHVNKPVGMMGFQNFEDSVLEKLRKAAEKRKLSEERT